MAHTKVTKNGTQNTGAVNTFSYSGSFDVFKSTEVKIDLDNVALTYTASTINESASPREYTVDITAKTVHIGGADLAASNNVVIRPFTDMGAPTPRATYTPGASITSDDLNNNQLQLMRKAMEYDENKMSTTGGTMTGHLTMGEDTTIVFEGATDDAYETTLTVTDPTADHTVTLPNTTGTVPVLAVHSDTSITATPAELNYSDGVTSNIQTQLDAKQPLDAELTELATMNGATASALADLSATEVQIIDGATLTTTELNYVDGVTSAIQTQLDGKQASGSYQPLDADLTELADMQTGAAAKLKLLTADEIEKIDDLTASTAELNKLDGVTATTDNLNITASMTKQTTISDSDTSYPTSGAVVDYVAAQIATIGGLEVIATDAAFPNDQPSSGVVISIADAGGLVVNGSGQSTTGRTVGASTLNINNINSSFHSDTIVAGIGMLVTSTGAGHIYNYHKTVIKEADVAQISDDINDFNSRYRIGDSDPGSDNDEGDLFFNKTANKMKVYDGSNWGEVTSTGDFKYLVLTEAGTTNAASYDGSKVSFDLKEDSTSGSAASVTNAAQLMVSINGVIQKPNDGTNTSGLDGFVMTDADTIKFTAGVPTGASVFVIQSGSALAINVPGDNTVTEGKLNVSNSPTNGYYLQAQSGATGGLTWAAVSQYTTPLTTRGDILYRDASGDQRLAKGTDGQFLKIGANDPEWADVIGAVANGCIYENDQTISADHTIASGKGAHSVGPITVNATVTVNGNWVVS